MSVIENKEIGITIFRSLFRAKKRFRKCVGQFANMKIVATFYFLFCFVLDTCNSVDVNSVEKLLLQGKKRMFFES